ncbi:diguanylate cyclase/phosphodiesterase with PAS/PAC sensor(s) [Sulfurimonas gotlandica GD1]|uniref:Diguanylate cyclase/phosphodiesterase with PAS/PAC sensor(S) n=1 Tax=Sulfurimonas gotlandica (strain DSM 19862 / JCM 16533 / GD1) TaxID=929558 RepID=B6BNN5_SULGG|nr:EAL domain-containing protein [Sulfurimonas gotlandica]EDZ61302.1 ggef/eal/pas/pac-domain containing protein [Sulfurimonas gotlandica GD1]EHP28838.1 diguanylate cyclase/phosphodiesterase with PAS/PAC sensor(s) [Sulfurimonas gotlandica GD1]
MKHTKIGSIIVSQSIASISPDKTIEDALNHMQSNAVSSIVIVDANNQPIGIFTEHDALKAIANSLQKSTLLSEVIAGNLFMIKEDIYMHDAYIMMQNKGYRHIIVTNENDEFVGVVSEGDFLRHIGYIDVGALKAVEDIMNEAPLMIDSNALIVDVAKMMSERHADTAIVMKNLKAHGVVRERDVTRYYAHKDFSLDSTVKKIIQKDLHFVVKSIPLQKAAQMMEEHGIHQLVVADSQEKIIGIINRHEVLKTIHGAYFETLLKTIREKNEDLDESRKREEELQKKETAMNEAQSIARVGSWSIDLKTNTLSWSNECYNIFGIEHGTQMNYELFVEMIHKDDKENALLAWDEALKGAKFEIEHRVIVGSETKWVREKAKFVIDEDGTIVSGIGTVQDITERKQYENKLERLANFDTLTGFANRTFLFSYLQKVVHRCKRNNKIAALLVLDMDHFKDINDSYGHDIGDELLALIAKRLSTRIRGGDFIARLDGDKFAIILEDINNSDDAAMFAKEIMEEVEKPFYLSNTSEVHICSTAGIVIAPENAETAEELIQFADTALYKGKKDKRGGISYYSDELTELAKKHIELATRLRRAIEHSEFELYYQPQVHIKSKRIVGAEALIRWNDPIHGLISPNDFIPLAEETGLIGAIGEWVIRDACRQGKLWIDKGYNLSISVNVSANQLRHQNITRLIDSTLKETGFTADKLVIELTESAVMQREEEAVAMLHAIRAKGIRLAIDDFGTGYSSYSYLKRFPIDILKIDKSFIDEVPFENDDMAIVKAIIAMGSALGYKILAEGTEHIEQIDFLEEHGCQYYQGYYKSKPLKTSEFEKLLL